MIKNIPDPQRVHSITCFNCQNTFIISHLKTSPAYCTVCGASLTTEHSEEKSLSMVEGLKPEKEAIQFSIGAYQILSSIGKGGMGEVFLAYDTGTGRKLALKKIRNDLLKHAIVKGRFLREARITCQLTHPGIIPIYGIFSEGNEIYYTMPYVEGENLKQILRKGRKKEKAGEKSEATSIAALIRIFTDICQAVAYAHSKNVLHRDLKPENVIVGPYGEVMILDWGLAKLMEMKEDDLPTNNTSGTRTGKIVGTLSYLAPERALGAEASVKSDIYALGVILYQLLTLKMPFHRPSLREFRKNLPIEKIINPNEAAPYREVPEILSRICLKMLEREPSKRYETVEKVIYDLSTYLEGRAEFTLSAELKVENKNDWQFQENVLMAEQVAITRGLELSNWVSLMISKQSFTENLKLEVTFKIGDNCQGLGFLLNIPEADERESPTDGLLVWLRAKGDEPTKIIRSNVEVITAPDRKLEAGKLYELKIEKIDKSLNVWLNHELELTYVSHMPIRGTHVGFLSRDFDFAINRFNVYEGSQNVMISCLSVPDAFLSNKNYNKALTEYRRIAYSFPGRLEGRQAAFQAGVTYIEEAIDTQNPQKFDLALEEFEKLKKTPGAPLEYLGKALVYHALNEPEEELKCYELTLRRDPHHPLNSILEEQILFRTYETLSTDRKSAYAFLLLILQYLPKLAEGHTVKRILANVVKHAEPLYFFEWTKELRHNRYAIALFLAFWLNRPFTIYEILEALEGDQPILIQNGLFALQLMDPDLFRDVQEKKGFTLDPNHSQERELIFNLGQFIDKNEPDKVLEELKSDHLTVPLSCLKIQATLLKQEFEKAGKELYHYPLEWHTKETTLLPFLYGVWLYETEGKDLALIHFNGIAETAFPRTWTLGSLSLSGRLPDSWHEKAFWWEKHELERQLLFFKRVTNSE